MDSAQLRWVVALGLVGLWLAASGAAAQGGSESADETLSPYFFVQGAYEDAEPFPLESTDVVAHVSGVIADVTVRQVYRNDGAVPITARYVFPASTRAAVHGMRFRIGEHLVVAKVKAREQAAAEFREAEAAGKSASLLEQERPSVFTMSVANVMPGDRVEVELRYSELLVPSEGVYSFVYPTVVGPRYAGSAAADAGPADGFAQSAYLHEGETPPTGFSIAVHLSAGLPLAQLVSRSHAVQVAREGSSIAHVSLQDAASFGGNRDFVLDYQLAGAQIESGLLLYEGEQENHFLLMLQPPARVSKAAIAPREYVFVLDVSGSMHGFPLDTAKVLIADLITQLRPTDTFNVVLFSGDSHTMAPRSVPATNANVKRALEVIEEERGNGGTELAAALRTVHALPRTEHVSRSVVVLTDGYLTEERGTFELIAQHLGDTNVFAFGIGSSVNRYLIEGLARAGQGEPFVVTDPHEAGATARRFRRYIESPVLTEIAVRFDGFDAYDLEPAVQPDLFAERPILISGKYRGKAGAIEVTGRGAREPFVSRTELSAATPRAENAALPRLWARSRIARLSDYDVSGADEPTAREVTALGLQYSLLTKHTSFVAVLEQVRNTGEPTQVDQPLPMPLGVSDSAIGSGGEYASGAEPELLWLLLPLLAFAALRNRHRATWSRA
jgi:Ca-activated chloride channel family protein